MSSLYVHTPTFSGDHTVIHHCYPQTACCHRSGGVVFYHQPLYLQQAPEEREQWGWKGEASKKTYKLVSFSKQKFPINTHPVHSAWTCTFRVLHCCSCWHSAQHMLSNLCSLTETEPDILLHTWKYWQRSRRSTRTKALAEAASSSYSSLESMVAIKAQKKYFRAEGHPHLIWKSMNCSAVQAC